jgi:hypothetical protein
MYILDSRGPKADHQVHEVAYEAQPWYSTVCQRLAMGPVYKGDPPAVITYCRKCLEAKTD